MGSIDNHFPTVRPLRFLLGGVVLVALSWATAQSARAQEATPTPVLTPDPTHTVGWRNSASAILPQGLQTTAVVAPIGGGPTGPDGNPCDTVAVPGGAEVWAFSESTLITQEPDGIGNPADDFIVAQHCGEPLTVAVVYTLKGPTGIVAEVKASDEENVFTESTFADSNKFIYGFASPGSGAQYSSYSPPGAYQLTIETPTHTIIRDFRVNEYTGQRITLYNADTGMAQVTYTPGDNLAVAYSGFNRNDVVEVGLYRRQPGDEYGGLLVLIDTWQLTIASNDGVYLEELPIPVGTPSGGYLLMVCQIATCKPKLLPQGLGLEWPRILLARASVEGVQAQPVLGPPEVVESFYTAINDALTTGADFYPAYNLLSSKYQESLSYDDFKASQSSFINPNAPYTGVKVEDITLLEEAETAAVRVVVNYMSDNNGEQGSFRIALTWLLVIVNGEWRLDNQVEGVFLSIE
jgi:hypothetical protein